jgi:hypothetical protein
LCASGASGVPEARNALNSILASQRLVMIKHRGMVSTLHSKKRIKMFRGTESIVRWNACRRGPSLRKLSTHASMPQGLHDLRHPARFGYCLPLIALAADACPPVHLGCFPKVITLLLPIAALSIAPGSLFPLSRMSERRLGLDKYLVCSASEVRNWNQLDINH